jgi:1-acyl-sn-glycerol-3-phosphate acyltransferase
MLGFLDALRRLGRFIDPEDLRMLLPHRFAAAALQMAIAPKPEAAPAPLDARDPAFVGALLDLVREAGRTWFRFRCEGIDRVPERGPALLVGNHNGGLFTYDALFAWMAVRDRLGPDRAVYGLGHDLLQWDPRLRAYAARLGILRASHAEAERALRAGHLVQVFPGSDFDSFRPFHERTRIVLAGRTGFVRLALRARVPVVPVVGVGGQEQFIVLTRGEGLARWMGLKRLLRTNVFPIAWSVPWGFTSAYLPYVPLPAQITLSFLQPLRWDLLPEGGEDDEATVQACYREIESVMQAEHDRLHRRVPWWGTPA